MSDQFTPTEMREAITRQLGIIPPDDWPSVEEQEAYWSLRDEGRSDGHGESYAERNT